MEAILEVTVGATHIKGYGVYLDIEGGEKNTAYKYLKPPVVSIIDAKLCAMEISGIRSQER